MSWRCLAVVGPVRTGWDQCLPHNLGVQPLGSPGILHSPLEGPERQRRNPEGGGKGGLEHGGGSGEGDTIPGGKLSCIFGKRRDCLDRSQQEQTP